MPPRAEMRAGRWRCWTSAGREAVCLVLSQMNPGNRVPTLLFPATQGELTYETKDLGMFGTFSERLPGSRRERAWA